MEMLKEKLISRKFWLAIISILTGVLGLFGVADSTIEMVSSVALILVPAIAYIFVEGKVDAAAVAGKIDFEALRNLFEEFLMSMNDETDTTVKQVTAIKAGDRGEEPPGTSL